MIKNSEMSTEEKLSRERIIYLINEYCNGSQAEMVAKTGINKALISQYVNGKNSIGNKTAAIMGKAFNVDPMWIMGFDVSPGGDELARDTGTLLGKAYLNKNAIRLLELFFDMEEENRAKLMQVAEAFALIPKNDL